MIALSALAGLNVFGVMICTLMPPIFLISTDSARALMTFPLRSFPSFSASDWRTFHSSGVCGMNARSRMTGGAVRRKS